MDWRGLRSYERKNVRAAVRTARRQARRDPDGFVIDYKLGQFEVVANETIAEGIASWQQHHDDRRQLEATALRRDAVLAQHRFIPTAALNNPYLVKAALTRVAQQMNTTWERAAVDVLKESVEVRSFIRAYIAHEQRLGGTSESALSNMSRLLEKSRGRAKAVWADALSAR